MRTTKMGGGGAAAAVMVMVLAVGCGAGDQAVSACTPGRSTACVCAGGRSGAQTCQLGGTYAACSCAEVDAGGGVDAPGVVSVDVVDAGPGAVDAPAPDVPVDTSSDVPAVIDVPVAVDVPPAPMDVAPPCPSPQALCAERCVSLQTDRLHCGACDIACAAGSRCVAGACELDACGAPASTRCGSDLATGWLRSPMASTCSPAFVDRDFSSAAVTTAEPGCGTAVDITGSGTNAERPLGAVVSTCSSPVPFTITMVGRLPTSYQRSLGFALRWATGESVILNRWVWNYPGESGTDVTVTTSAGTLVNYMSSSADTGLARSDRPWGWYIGNDGGWWRMTVTVDPAADTVTATFAQPSQGPTEYMAVYSTPIPDGPVPSLKLITAGPCAGGGLSAQLLSLTVNPPLWR